MGTPHGGVTRPLILLLFRDSTARRSRCRRTRDLTGYEGVCPQVSGEATQYSGSGAKSRGTCGTSCPMTHDGSSERVLDQADQVGRAEIVAFAEMTGDDTGAVTFERFRWQAKLAVRAWLGTLASGGVVAVVCEHVEDLAFIEVAGFCFAQLKTRDKGSWSVAKICAEDHAVDRLAASYLLAETAGIVSHSRFEVWLEGAPSEAKETTDFFKDPKSATAGIKRKIREFGLQGAQVDDFLSRLSVHCHQPARPSIDAVVIRLIGAIWPALTLHQAERLYESLLRAAEAAQGATATPPSIREVMSAALADLSNSELLQPIASKCLTVTQARALCPPLPTDTDQDLLNRAATGEASLLELKMVRAGASDDTIQSALLARADAEVAATQGRASGSMTEELEEAFDSRLLASAHSVAAAAAAAGVALSRPGEYVYHTLMGSPANTAALDIDGFYRRDPRLVVGHLCGVSDQCRYGWGMS